MSYKQWPLCLAPLWLCALAASAGSLVSNGDFSRVDARMKAADWHPVDCEYEVVREGENAWVKLRNDDPEAVVTVVQNVRLPEGVDRLRVAARIRATDLQPGGKNWQTANVIFRFTDDNKKAVGGYGPTPRVTEDCDWTLVEVTADVPAGATRMGVRLGLYHATGVAEFDDIVVEPASEEGELIEPTHATPPADWPITWHQEPIERRGPHRDEVCLNGLWRFMPTNSAAPPPSRGWGLIGVPGSWIEPSSNKTTTAVRVTGAAPAWSSFNGRRTTAAWYERPLRIPESWEGRAVVLDLKRVSTDAQVFVDGQPAGETSWPGGEVDLTGLVEPGGEHNLQILVLAAGNEGEVIRFRDANDPVKVKARLATRGIIGDVMLVGRPMGPRLDHVGIATSVREKQLNLALRLKDVKRGGPAEVTARVLGTDGSVECTFTRKVRLQPADTQTVNVSFDWPAPRLWEVDDPHLYTLDLSIEGRDGLTLADSTSLGFGFREFWIDGRDFVLNGQVIRLRPMQDDTRNFADNPDMMEHVLRNAKASGYNTLEHWPTDPAERGRPLPEAWMAEAADRLGFLLIARLPDTKPYLLRKRYPSDPAVRDEFQGRARRLIEQLGHHPSIVMWVSSPNFYAFSQDQNPRWIGRDATEVYAPGQLENRVRHGLAFFEALRELDPTRPIMSHHGGIVGDAHTVNMYLNFHPLQEREEWLSDYVVNGDRPFLPVEFGVPLNCSFMRGRNGGGWGSSGQGAIHSEPLVTEYSAIYLGPDAYLLETPRYRKLIRSFHRGNNVYRDWRHGAVTHEPNSQALLSLFVANTWRSWRTWGAPGGMIPWENAAGWHVSQDTKPHTRMPAFRPGRRGVYHPQFMTRMWDWLDPSLRTASGETLAANNRSTLGWIAGAGDKNDSASFTDKTRNYRAGDEVRKQLVLINDTRRPQPYAVTWRAIVDGQTVDAQTLSGRVGVTETLMLPIAFMAPSSLAADKVDGRIEARFEIGDHSHDDVLAFRVFETEAGSDESFRVTVLDDVGATRMMLEDLGVQVEPWDGAARPEVLVIGRLGLAQMEERLPQIERYVEDGGRLVIMAQAPDAWESLGFRTAKHQSRRVFPIAADHPVNRGLDHEDLTNWANSSTLLEARPDYIANNDWLAAGTVKDNGQVPARGVDPVRDVENRRKGWPYAGWRWGNRHTVASTSIEKPHRSGWRPIFQCEFDLAYTPLMELDHGRGVVVVCTLDLEDHYQADPAAERVAQRLIEYVHSRVPSPRGAAGLIGGDEDDERLLNLLGVDYEPGRVDAPLIIVGRGAQDAEAIMSRAAGSGQRVFVLPRGAEEAWGPVRFEARSGFGGSVDLPDWPEARGLSISDLRARTDYDAVVLGAGEAEIAADGLLGRQRVGDGVVLFCQAGPEEFDVDQDPYLRLTRWRQTRMLSQLLANLGASFRNDVMLFDPAQRPNPADSAAVDLRGPWRAAATRLVPPAPSFQERLPDPGVSDEAQGYAEQGFEEDDAKPINLERLPLVFEPFKEHDGEAVLIREFELPADWEGQDLELYLGQIDDLDVTYFNGEEVGRVDAAHPSPWNVIRRYRVPARLVRGGNNRLAIRVWDAFGGGGLTGPVLRVRPFNDPDNLAPGLYHPDYNTDFSHGDDPYRYYRW